MRPEVDPGLYIGSACKESSAVCAQRLTLGYAYIGNGSNASREQSQRKHSLSARPSYNAFFPNESGTAQNMQMAQQLRRNALNMFRYIAGALQGHFGGSAKNPNNCLQERRLFQIRAAFLNMVLM